MGTLSGAETMSQSCRQSIILDLSSERPERNQAQL
jgi:hypothetical protein